MVVIIKTHIHIVSSEDLGASRLVKWTVALVKLN